MGALGKWEPYAISTGYYGYPMLDAGIVAIEAITEFFAVKAEFRIPVYLTAYSDLNGDILAALLEPAESFTAEIMSCYCSNNNRCVYKYIRKSEK